MLPHGNSVDPLAPLDWVTVYAMAVNEENAAGGRVVTAPTNGAAGVMPAVAHYYSNSSPSMPTRTASSATSSRRRPSAFSTRRTLPSAGRKLAARAKSASPAPWPPADWRPRSAATNEQVEHAAEIAMEHNLGMTCDPIGGLVQIPCIERNAMGAVKAVNACRMAMNETEGHKVSLDQVIRHHVPDRPRYAVALQGNILGGLALNIIEC